MCFDFNKAINGEPIYYEGRRIFPIFKPDIATFECHYGDLLYWHKDGSSISNKGVKECSLSTDPSKVYRSVSIFKDNKHGGYSAEVTGFGMYMEKAGYTRVKTIEVEI